jgi:LysM repeat protein
MEKIARQTNVSLADLLRLNPQVEPTRMKVGTKLNLP